VLHKILITNTRNVQHVKNPFTFKSDSSLMGWVKEPHNIFPAARIFHKNEVTQLVMKDLLSNWECYRKKCMQDFRILMNF